MYNVGNCHKLIMVMYNYQTMLQELQVVLQELQVSLHGVISLIVSVTTADSTSGGGGPGPGRRPGRSCSGRRAGFRRLQGPAVAGLRRPPALAWQPMRPGHLGRCRGRVILDERRGLAKVVRGYVFGGAEMINCVPEHSPDDGQEKD